jgi:hypothetical protein
MRLLSVWKAMKMSSEKIVYNLLSTNTALKAVVPQTSMYAGLIPLNATLPALAYTLVSVVETTSIGMTANKYRGRVQVTVAAKTYPQTKQIIGLVKTACNHKQGTFNGVKTDSVIMDNIGSDFRDDDAGIFYATIDFRLAYDE